ncbi:DUF6248 family natural product biosynthesis protein [[Kitasatospora] papulosa]|uniref:DUF6248 family natural product biosynthesis protein n=1 Tax=[Kitasatospora] papulosa TaxID=1464011 RepID=UPI0036878DE7
MTPDQAAWVRAHALPPRVLKSMGGEALLAKCACQLGRSGNCVDGRCDQCAHRTSPAWYDRPWPETYVLDRAQAGAGPEVWITGVDCRWRCTCGCHSTTAEERGLLFDVEVAR